MLTRTKGLFLIIFSVLLLSTSVSAQSTETNRRTKQSDPFKLKQYKPEPKVVDGTFITVSALLAATTVFDIETTFRIKKKYPKGFRELNPLMAPFIKMGRPAAYSVAMGLNALGMYDAYKRKERGRKSWFVAPLIMITAHGVVGGFSLRF